MRWRIALGASEAEYLSFLLPTMHEMTKDRRRVFVYFTPLSEASLSEPLRNTLLPATSLSLVAWLL